jgi:hypothetical protein
MSGVISLMTGWGKGSGLKGSSCAWMLTRALDKMRERQNRFIVLLIRMTVFLGFCDKIRLGF